MGVAGKLTTCPKHPNAHGHLEPVKRTYKGRVYEYYRFVHAAKRREKPQKCYIRKVQFVSEATPEKIIKHTDRYIKKIDEMVKDLRSRTEKLPSKTKDFVSLIKLPLELNLSALNLMRYTQKLRTRFMDEGSEFALFVSDFYSIPQVIAYLETLPLNAFEELNRVGREIVSVDPLSNPKQFIDVVRKSAKPLMSVGRDLKYAHQILAILIELWRTEVRMPDKILRKLMRKYGGDEVMPSRISRILSSLVPEKHLRHLQYNWKKERNDIILQLFLDGHLKAFPVSPKHLSKIIRNISNAPSKDIINDKFKRELKRFVESRRVIIEDSNLPDKFKEYVKTESPMEKIYRISYEIIQEYNSKRS